MSIAVISLSVGQELRTMAMEGLLRRLCLVLSLFLIVSSLTVTSSQAQPSARAGVIERSKSRLLLASINSSDSATPLSSQLFLTSPSGNSAAYLIRHKASSISQGVRRGFCYIQVQGNGNSIWDSTCAPVTLGNACVLVFSDVGLQIFNGGKSSWRTNTNRGHLRYLVLTDVGDMEILDQRGTIMWTASQEQIVNKNCGIYSTASPFATPSDSTMPSLGQGMEEDGGISPPQWTYPSELRQDQNYPQQAANVAGGFTGSSNQQFSSFNQPIGQGSLGEVSISPFDNGVPDKGVFMTGVVNVVLSCLLYLMILHQLLFT